MQIPQIINKNRFYRIEQEEFEKEKHICLTQREAKRFTRKICQHFKLPQVALKFHVGRSYRDSGNADWSENIIRVSPNPSVMTLAHELSHIATKSGHTKRSLAIMEKIILYARKRNYWRELIA